MIRAALAIVVLPWFAWPGPITQEKPRNVWENQYKERSAADMAAQFENSGRPVFRHRAEIIRLLELKPGSSVAEIGAGSGFLSRMAAQEVGRDGRVTATELDPKMVAYMNERARLEGLTNVTAITGRIDAAGLEAQSMDAILIVNTYSFFDRPHQMMESIVEALKPGALLLIVDFPPRQGEGTDPERVIATATGLGLTFLGRRDVVPSHFALRFRKR